MARPKKIKNVYDDRSNNKPTGTWQFDTNDKKVVHIEKFLPAVRHGWNDAALGRPYSSYYEKNVTTFQWSYEHGRLAFAQWKAMGNKPVIWLSAKVIPEAFIEASNKAVIDDGYLVPPVIDPTLEPKEIEEKIEVY